MMKVLRIQKQMVSIRCLIAVLLFVTSGHIVQAQTDPLPSWNDGPSKQALDQANERKWVVVDVKRDWRVIYPFDK
ncbi:MAG TPA: hypothetical protein VLB68_13120 [Pyrinomonadaceae bacterium]|nr:hypothetical protein [Pyrinomonadaceae bacterium]